VVQWRSRRRLWLVLPWTARPYSCSNPHRDHVRLLRTQVRAVLQQQKSRILLMAAAYYSKAVKESSQGGPSGPPARPPGGGGPQRYRRSELQRFYICSQITGERKRVSNMVSNRYIYELCSANPKKKATSGMTFIRDSRRTRIIRGPTHEAGAEL